MALIKNLDEPQTAGLIKNLPTGLIKNLADTPAIPVEERKKPAESFDLTGRAGDISETFRILDQPLESKTGFKLLEKIEPVAPKTIEKRKNILSEPANVLRLQREGIENPFVDPVTAFTGGFGSTAFLTKNIAKGLLSGLAAAVTEPALGQATEAIAGKFPALAFPVALVLGIASGNLLERPVENLIFKAATKRLSSRGVTLSTKNIQNEINTLKPEDVVTPPTAKKIVPEENPTIFKGEIERLQTQVREDFLKVKEAFPDMSSDQIRFILKNDKAGFNKFVKQAEKILPKPSLEQPQAGLIAHGQELPKFAKNINLERIDAGEDVKKIITDTVGLRPIQINEATRGKITFDETTRLANELGLTQQELLKRRKGKAFNAEEALAARDVLNTSATKLRESQIKAAKSGSDEDLANFKLTLERHAAIQAEVSGLTAEAGRALSAFRIKSRDVRRNQQNKNFKAMIDAVGGRELTEDILDRFKSIDPTDQIAVNKFIQSVTKAKTSDMVFEAWVNSLLSSPVTHVVNTTSNALVFLSSIPEKFGSATIDFLRAGLTRKQRTRFFGETPQRIFGAWEGIKAGTRKGIWSFVNELPTDDVSKLEVRRFQAIPGPVGKVVRLPGRFLIAMDEFFKGVNFESEIRTLAYRQAAQEGLTGPARANRIGEILANPSDMLTSKARQESLYRTFTNELGPSGRALQSVRTNTPGLRYIIPFLRTPINIAKFGLERTPLNYPVIFRKALKGDLKAGELSDELAKTTMGSMIGATVFMHAMEGNITGAGPKDPLQRQALFNTGWQPYSIKLGNQYVSYQRLEPMGMIMGTAADAAEIWDNLEPGKQEGIAGMIVASIGKNFINKTFMRGLSDAFNAIHDPSRYGDRWVQSFGGTVVPSAVNQLARTIDPVLRKPENFIEKIKSRTPGLKEDILPRRNTFGEVVKVGEGSFAERFLSPVQRSKAKGGFLEREIVRLKLGIGPPSKKIQNVELTPEQFDRFHAESGQLAKQLLNNFIKSGQYRKIPTDELKADTIKKLIRAARDQTKGKFIKEIGTDRIREETLKRYGF